MKAKPSSASGATKKTGSASAVTAILKTPKKPVTEAIHTTEKPAARGKHNAASREEIRETIHRVMGSRQSQRPVERSDQPRKKRG